MRAAGYLHMSLECVWDDTKATSNVSKYGMTFEEAETVFGDPLAAIFDDERHYENNVSG